MEKIKKSDFRKYKDLEAHLYLLQEHLKHFSQDSAYYKTIVAELRVLICKTRANNPILLQAIRNNKFTYKVTLNQDSPFETEHIDFTDMPDRLRLFYAVHISHH